MRARPDLEHERLIAAVRSGVALTAALAELGIPSATVRSWRHRDPDFARRLDEAREVGAVPLSAAPLGHAEWEALLAARCREGSVSALRLWMDAHGAERDRPPEVEDELAKLRALHHSIEARL